MYWAGQIQNGQNGAIAIILYLSFVSAIAYSLWGVLLKYNPISKVTVLDFLPIAGVILSALLLQEKQDMGLGTLIALILVSCGIYLVNRDSDKKRKK